MAKAAQMTRSKSTEVADDANGSRAKRHEDARGVIGPRLTYGASRPFDGQNFPLDDRHWAGGLAEGTKAGEPWKTCGRTKPLCSRWYERKPRFQLARCVGPLHQLMVRRVTQITSM